MVDGRRRIPVGSIISFGSVNDASCCQPFQSHDMAGAAGWGYCGSVPNVRPRGPRTHRCRLDTLRSNGRRPRRNLEPPCPPLGLECELKIISADNFRPRLTQVMPQRCLGESHPYVGAAGRWGVRWIAGPQTASSLTRASARIWSTWTAAQSPDRWRVRSNGYEMLPICTTIFHR